MERLIRQQRNLDQSNSPMHKIECDMIGIPRHRQTTPQTNMNTVLNAFSIVFDDKMKPLFVLMIEETIDFVWWGVGGS